MPELENGKGKVFVMPGTSITVSEDELGAAAPLPPVPAPGLAPVPVPTNGGGKAWDLAKLNDAEVLALRDMARKAKT